MCFSQNWRVARAFSCVSRSIEKSMGDSPSGCWLPYTSCYRGSRRFMPKLGSLAGADHVGRGELCDLRRVHPEHIRKHLGGVLAEYRWRQPDREHVAVDPVRRAELAEFA